MKAFVHENLFKLDGDIPVVRAIPYGIQHILAMFVANLAPILIVGAAAGLADDQLGMLVQSAMLIAGIGTLIQLFPLWRVGSGLPIVMGISFTFVTVLVGIAATYGYNVAIGAIIVGGIIEGVLGLFAKYWRRIISPIVAAVVVTSIGFSLLGVGASSFGGGSGAADFGSPQNLLLGALAVLSVLTLVGIAARAARVISRKMEPLADAVRRIEERDLDFEVASSRVREIDDVLAAMDDMRASLKDSLEAQWRGEQAQREQIAALAHDLKTPLTVVRGNVDLLLEGELSGEQRSCAADVAEGARQMGTYVSALIDASLGAGATFAPREARLRPLLERLRAQVEALAAASGVRVAWSEGADLPETMLLDEALVERAVANAAANAVEHAPAGSSVAVDVRADAAAGCLALSVADEGPGFSPEALSRGCERFYQGDAARAARGHSGLGLHVAAEAAARHGGSVELANRSAAEGGGARVALRLRIS